MSRVVVLGNATVDLILRVDRLPVSGETRIGSSLMRCAGGKGLNQAVAASRAGAEVTLVAAIGGDADAAFLRAALDGERLTARWLACGHPTDLSSIWVAADGENMIVSSGVCAASLAPAQAEAELAGLDRGDWLLSLGESPARAGVVAVAAASRSVTRAGTLPSFPDAAEIAELIGSG